MENSNIDDRLPKLLYTARKEAGRSQEYMSLEMGLARRTVQNWEKGVSTPSISQVMAWFAVLGTAAWPYLLQYVYPEVSGIKGSDETEKIRRAFMAIIPELPDSAVRQLMYLFYGDHGSSPRAVLALMNAHLQTPMKDRVTQAGVIIRNYELAKIKNELTGPDHVQPDVKMLNDALEAGRQAVINDKKGYGL